jgi:hypothetical protein
VSQPAAAAKAPASKVLTPAAVQRSIARQKAAFDKCVETALGGPGGPALAGRKTGLLIAISNAGAVEASEVEDADIEASALGACLRRAAERLAFPPFEGETVGIRVPLQLSATGVGGFR